jgi:hypothetical protein
LVVKSFPTEQHLPVESGKEKKNVRGGFKDLGTQCPVGKKIETGAYETLCF